MIRFKSTNVEELTEMSVWTIRDHLGEYVNILLGSWDNEMEDCKECALNYVQVVELRNKLTTWLDDPARADKWTHLIEGDEI